MKLLICNLIGIVLCGNLAAIDTVQMDTLHADVDVPYRHELKVAAPSPCEFKAIGLPPGLRLLESIITGVPESSGTWHVGLEVTAKDFNYSGTFDLEVTGGIKPRCAAAAGGGASPINASPNPASPRSNVKFNAATADAACQWDFGDGNVGQGRNLAHRYASAGVYSARATIGAGASATVHEIQVAVRDTKPIVAPAAGSVGTIIRITGAGFGAKGKLTISKPNVKGVALAIVNWTDTQIDAVASKAAPAGSYDVTIVPKGGAAILAGDAFMLKAPQIVGVGSSGTNGTLTINGTYFGTVNGSVKLNGKTSKVLKWVTNTATGESSADVQLPKGITAELVTQVTLANKIGMSQLDFGSGDLVADRMKSLPYGILQLKGNFDTKADFAVRFSDGVFPTEVHPVSIDTNELLVVVPPYFNFGTGSYTAATVSIEVFQTLNGSTKQSSKLPGFQILDLPQLKATPGSAVLHYVTAKRDITMIYTNALRGSGLLSDNALAGIGEMLDGESAILVELQRLVDDPGLTYSFSDGGSQIEVNARSLHEYDRLIVGMLQVQGVLGGADPVTTAQAQFADALIAGNNAQIMEARLAFVTATVNEGTGKSGKSAGKIYTQRGLGTDFLNYVGPKLDGTFIPQVDKYKNYASIGANICVGVGVAAIGGGIIAASLPAIAIGVGALALAEYIEAAAKGLALVETTALTVQGLYLRQSSDIETQKKGDEKLKEAAEIAIEETVGLIGGKLGKGLGGKLGGAAEKKTEDIFFSNFVEKTGEKLTSETISKATDYKFLANGTMNLNKLLAETIVDGLVATPTKVGGLEDVGVSEQAVTLKFYDNGAVDGDAVTVTVNGVVVEAPFVLEGPPGRDITIFLVYGTNTIEILALNEGSVSPNTAAMEISSVINGKSVQQYELKAGETATFNIVAQPELLHPILP